MDLDVILGKEMVEVVLDGVKYEASRLTLGDFAEFRAWAKQQKLAAFLRAASSASLEAELFSKVVEDLLDSGAKLKRDSDGEAILDSDGNIIVENDPVANAMGTEEGMRQILALSIRHKHSDFDDGLLSDLAIEDLGKLADVITRISIPAGGVDPNVPAKGTQKKEGSTSQ